jgi:hypothetical protein
MGTRTAFLGKAVARMSPAIASPIGPSCFDLGLEGFLVAPSRPLQAGAAKQSFSPEKGLIPHVFCPICPGAGNYFWHLRARSLLPLRHKSGHQILPNWSQFHKAIIGACDYRNALIFRQLRCR